MFNVYDCWGTLLETRKKRSEAMETANKMLDAGYKLHYVTDDKNNKVVWVGFKHPDDLKTVLDNTKRKTLLWSL